MPRLEPEFALPERPYRPGEGPHPSRRESAPTPQPSTAFPTAEAWARDPAHRYAIDLFHHGAWWEAHEIWEHYWKRAPEGSPERDVLQGLILVSAIWLKRAPDPTRATPGLSARALDRLDRHRERIVCGLPVATLYESVRAEESEPPTLSLVR